MDLLKVRAAMALIAGLGLIGLCLSMLMAMSLWGRTDLVSPGFVGLIEGGWSSAVAAVFASTLVLVSVMVSRPAGLLAALPWLALALAPLLPLLTASGTMVSITQILALEEQASLQTEKLEALKAQITSQENKIAELLKRPNKLRVVYELKPEEWLMLSTPPTGGISSYQLRLNKDKYRPNYWFDTEVPVNSTFCYLSGVKGNFKGAVELDLREMSGTWQLFINRGIGQVGAKVVCLEFSR